MDRAMREHEVKGKKKEREDQQKTKVGQVGKTPQHAEFVVMAPKGRR